MFGNDNQLPFDSDAGTVRAWRETVVIPTYGVGEPNLNPMFLENRVYQGSSGVVYPLPVIDRIEDGKQDREWQAVFLENEFLKIMIMPELGGRVQMAFDKTNDYHFVYYNRVIKPALVGLAGPWISGGIEFNWPQHHRPSTFMPVDCEITVDTASGAASVWLHEIDRMHRTEAAHRLTLRPERAVLEIDVKLYNRTDLPQTFLWWANPAVHVDENHQSVFPPDVTAVMDHGKRDTSSFPIATGEYYKVDYSPGTDISRYRNIPVPTSYMAYRSDYNFVGSYDHGRRAGLLHVSNHHVSPGKKQWTWGTAGFGKAWERHLTDEDGPYLELMCGVYTDNQPDFSWLMPGETKEFSQYFMPYQGVGDVMNATVDAAVGLEIERGQVTVRAYTSSVQPNATATLRAGEAIVWTQSFDGGPGSCFEATVPLSDETRNRLSIRISSGDGTRLVAWTAPEKIERENPEPAKAIDTPDSIDSVESLYLAGQHLEQYRHATREPADYYREALLRDPGDARNNTALGKLLYRRGRFVEAEPYLRRAIQRLTRHNPNPYDGEPHYLLGCTLERLERYEDAYAAYHKAVWNAAWQDAGYFALARLDCRAGRLDRALENVDLCLSRNAAHRQARHLMVTVLRLLERTTRARLLCHRWLLDDIFHPGLLYEASRLGDENEMAASAEVFQQRMRDDQHNYVELALDYAAAGLYRCSIDVLREYLARVDGQPETAIVFYLLGEYQDQMSQGSDDIRQAAAIYRPDYCFPNRLEEIGPLQRAAQANPTDARAPYYLGNLWYDRRQYEAAISCWEQSRVRDPSFATVWRNLGLAYFNKRQDGAAAWQAFNEAFRLNESDGRVLFELDQLAKWLGHPPQQRLDRLSQHKEIVSERDDLSLEFVTLLNVLGRHQRALDVLLDRSFHPWEGGEGKVPRQYTLCLTQLAREAIAAGQFDSALCLLEQAGQWPRCLGEGKLPGNQENNVRYLQGVALQQLGQRAKAMQAFQRAARGISQPGDPMYYNDQPPDMIYYQGLALRALDREEEAGARFQSLIEYGVEHLADEPEIDFFAVSLPDFLVFGEDLKRRNELHCRYMVAMGMLGRGRIEDAVMHLDQVLAVDPSHLGAIVHYPQVTATDGMAR